MKNNLITIFSALALLLVFASCSDEKEPVVNGKTFEIESFEDFLWEKDPVDTIAFDLTTEFLQCNGIDSPVVLALCDKDGDLVKTNIAKVYVNGSKSADNTIELQPTGKSSKENLNTHVGIVINRSALSKDRTFYWRLKCVNPGEVTVLGVDSEGQWTSLDRDDALIGTDICVKNDHVSNSLKVWVNIIFWTLLIITATIIILVQVFAKRFNVTHLINIFVSENDSRRPIMNYKAGLKRTTEIILTFDRNKKQGLWAMLFKGRKSYVYIPNLPAEISLSVGSKGRVSHAICSRTANVMAEYDVPGRRMILSCKSDTFGTEYKIEYPRR